MSVILFFALLFPWFASSIIFRDYSFYQTINLPFFSPPSFVFMIVWPIIFVLITIVVKKVITQCNFKESKEFYKALLVNYIFNQAYAYVFFYQHNLFLSFIVCLITFLTSINLYIEAKKLVGNTAGLLFFYMIWTLFASILSATIYLINS